MKRIFAGLLVLTLLLSGIALAEPPTAAQVLTAMGEKIGELSGLTMSGTLDITLPEEQINVPFTASFVTPPMVMEIRMTIEGEEVPGYVEVLDGKPVLYMGMAGRWFRLESDMMQGLEELTTTNGINQSIIPKLPTQTVEQVTTASREAYRVLFGMALAEGATVRMAMDVAADDYTLLHVSAEIDGGAAFDGLQAVAEVDISDINATTVTIPDEVRAAQPLSLAL